MRALSLGLIKGKINQVKQLIAVEYLQPRILDYDRINILSNHINDFHSRLTNVLNSAESFVSVK